MLALGAALVGGPGVAPAPGATRATSAADLRRRGAVRRAKNALTAITHGEPAESACVPRQDTGTATQAGQLHLRSPCGRARHRSAPRRAPKISIAQAVATIPSNASSSKTPPKPEAWLPRGNVLRPGDLRLVDLTVPRRALPTPPLSPRRRTEECARRERAHDHRADATTLDGSALVNASGDASVVGVFLAAFLSRVGVRVFKRMRVPVVLVLLLLRSTVAVVARILLAFWSRHVASVHQRNHEVPGATSIETDAAPGSRCLAPSLS
jgi:hypothetical protein